MTLTYTVTANARHRSSFPKAPMVAFIICLAVPIVIHLGSLRLSPYRVVLLAMLMPCFWGWLTGAIGKTRLADRIVLAIASFSAASFLWVHGLYGGIESAGIVFIETLTPYLLARLCIRSRADFQTMVRLLLGLILVLLPFAFVETLTTWNGPLRILDSVFQTYADVAKPPRWGLDRVQGPFEHPILFGVFAGSALALGYYSVLRLRTCAATMVAVTAALSFSSGPLTALVAQTGMIGWDRIFSRYANRWIVLGVLTLLAYLVVDVISNRTPAEVFISYAAFNADTAYNRLLIWEWGWVNIWQNPWFGLGNSDWQRLWFMTASVDMFWIQRAMVHGLPVGILNQLLFFTVLIGLIRCRKLDIRTSRIRTGLAICLIGFYVAGMTAHFWDATFVWLMFLFGAAGWLREGACDWRADPCDDRPDPAIRRTPQGLLA